ncbi:MAG: hypothetical protein R2776_08870 [Flavobacteriaceae bacterium]
MYGFFEVVEQAHIKNHLQTTVQKGRIAHTHNYLWNKAAQVYLPLAIAYAKQILCSPFEPNSETYLRCEKNVANLAHRSSFCLSGKYKRNR